MRVPVATYRVQLHGGFGFEAARRALAYWNELGISDVYASPLFEARVGSLHGYDVVDPTRINPELGSREELEALFRDVQALGLGWVQDIVPNHMAYDSQNHMLMDVLENGRHSRFEGFFDLDWTSPYDRAGERVLAPFLGRPYGEALELGEIQVEYDAAGFGARYFGLRLPLRIESYEPLLTVRLAALKEELGEDHPDFVKFLGVLYVLRTASATDDPQERYDQTRFAKRLLGELHTGNKAIRRALEATLATLNGEPGKPESFDALDELLSQQLFRLSFWKVATEEIDYRRFFSVNGLMALRVERDDVFDHTHRAVLKLAAEGKLTGLRIDHIDGLYDPGAYLDRLRRQAPDMYLAVEKILAFGEEVPASWPVQGTTGYEFLNRLNGLFVKSGNERALDRTYAGFSRSVGSYDELLYEKKILILYRDLTGDLDNLGRLLKAVSSTYRHGADITLYSLRRAIAEVMAGLPVYRTYLDDEPERPEDRSYVEEAVEKARRRHPNLANEIAFLKRFLLLDFDGSMRDEEKQRWIHFVKRFQQFTSPLMAKAFEDTFLYVYNRLLSLNEVGGSPDRLGVTPEEFHGFNVARAVGHPHTMNATSTHDTKRGEDVRARLNVLSEIPDEWGRALREWRKINAPRRKKIARRLVPDGNDEYFLYQTLVGAWPFDEEDVPGFRERLAEYLVKAVREAKVHTAWLKPDEGYERAFLDFARDILETRRGATFVKAFLPFQKRVAHFGVVNSLAQTLLKIAAPGVPDVYQGSELWELSLVDPDNRRPVDFGRRVTMLRELRAAFEADPQRLVSDLLAHPRDGRLKLFLIHRALSARRERADLFREGEYIPLSAEGPLRDHVVAFARRRGEAWALAVVPRFPTGLVQEARYPLGREVWGDTRVPLPPDSPTRWTDALTGTEGETANALVVGDALSGFPAAFLVS